MEFVNGTEVERLTIDMLKCGEYFIMSSQVPLSDSPRVYVKTSGEDFTDLGFVDIEYGTHTVGEEYSRFKERLVHKIVFDEKITYKIV